MFFSSSLNLRGDFFLMLFWVLGLFCAVFSFFFFFEVIHRNRTTFFNRSSVWAFLLENVHNLKTPTMQKARAAKIHFQKCSAAFTQTVVKK